MKYSWITNLCLFLIIAYSSLVNAQVKSDTAYLLAAFQKGDSLINASNITEGKNLLDQIIPLLEENKLWPEYVRSINILSQLETDYGNISDALDLNDRGKDVIRKNQLENTNHDFSLTVFRANTLIKNHNYSEALILLNKLLKVARTKRTTVDTLSLHNQFSLAYSRQGKYSAALNHALKTITHDSLLTAVNCFNVASFYDVLDDGDKRDEYLLKAHKLAKEKEGVRGVFEQINVLLFMANLAKDESNLGLAKGYADEAEQLFLDLPNESQMLYSSLFSLVLRLQISIAIKLDDEVVVRTRMNEMKNYITPNACFSFNELSNYFGGKMNIAAQDSFLDLSRRCVERNSNNPVLKEFYNDAKVNALFRIKEYDQCVQLTMPALGIKNVNEIQAKLNSKDFNLVRHLTNLYKLSVYLYAAYHINENEKYLNAAHSISSKIDSLAEEKIKDVTSKLSRHKYDDYFKLSHHIYASKYKLSKKPDDLNLAIQKFERIRTYQQAKIYTHMLLKEDEVLKRAYKSEQKVLEELNELEQMLAVASDSNKSEIIDQISTVKKDLLDVRKRIKTTFPLYYKSRHQTEFPVLKDLQQAMTSEQKIITYSRKWDQLVAMEISKNGCEIHFITLPFSFSKELDAFMSHVQHPGGDDIDITMLSEYFIDYLELEKFKDITFIADPIMRAIPFEFLIDGFISPKESSGQVSVRYAYSLTSWLDRTTQAKNSKLVALTSSYVSDTKLSQTGQMRNLEDGMVAIPHTEKEVAAITELFNRNDVFKNPTKQQIKDALQSAGIIHFATHTVINNENPNFSKLVFDEPTNIDEENDIYLYEIPGLEMEAQLVCLSSCNSGIGKYISGEGITGLGQTFAYAGCKNIVQSMWPVDDGSTAELMKLFYTNLKEGQKKFEALSNAKRQFVKQAPDVWKHPYFWAGFVYYGDAEPIHRPKQIQWYWWIGGLFVLFLLYRMLKSKRQ